MMFNGKRGIGIRKRGFTRFSALLLFAALTAAEAAPAQEAPAPPESLRDARTELLEKTQNYRSETAALLEIVKKTADRKGEELETRRSLFEKGYISQSEFLNAQQRLDEARREVARHEQQLAAANHLLAEVAAALETPESPELKSPRSNLATIRFQGSAPWKIEDAAELANFFWKRFGRELPISAFGQTPTHNALGFDHRNRVDVAVHPESEEGKAVIQFLTDRAISFIGFGKPRPGSATGAHIHVGPPSNRLF